MSICIERAFTDGLLRSANFFFFNMVPGLTLGDSVQASAVVVLANGAGTVFGPWAAKTSYTVHGMVIELVGSTGSKSKATVQWEVLPLIK